MSTLSLRLPDSLHLKVKELAERDDISINQFIATAVAEKMAALLTVECLEERAARGSRAAFDRVLAKVPSRAPLPGDEWPAPGVGTGRRCAAEASPPGRRQQAGLSAPSRLRASLPQPVRQVRREATAGLRTPQLS